METRNCQNCKKDFTIEPDDFSFYEKMKVPPPTFCPPCRFMRRMSWRNDRSLHKRSCDLCTKSFISIYRSNVPFPVYCRECWWSDKWDAVNYGREYDFSKPFFQQVWELGNKVPRLGIWQRNVTNCDFSNMVGESKNVYLSISVVLGSENVFYSKAIDKSYNIYDSYNVKESDGCYEDIDGEKNYNTQHMVLSRGCLDSYFLFDCVNCRHCVLSCNLRNKEFYIRNKQYTKEEYFKELERLTLGSRLSRKKHKEEFKEMQNNAIHRYANIIKSPNSTGNNIMSSNNCTHCFDVSGAEDCTYTYRGVGQLKDCMDFDYGAMSELMYEYTVGARNDYNVKFSYSAMESVRNADYTESCTSSTNLFGCISIRNKENVILNKVYTKEDYENLRERIIKHMSDMPYIDASDRVYMYGEFYPFELSPFGYNESAAYDFFPLSKKEALEKGLRWIDAEAKNYTITMQNELIPDQITNTNESILKEIIECKHAGTCNHLCTTAFRVVGDELQYYKKNNIPIPDICPNCRHFERFFQVPQPKLWYRRCMCNKLGHNHKNNCQNMFETPYTEENPAILYCESCYQKEVI